MLGARLFFALSILVSLATASERALVITTDCGADMDDQWALAHMVVSPEFDVRAIVTTHVGKHTILTAPAAETSARNAREVLKHFPARSQPDVISGSSTPLVSRTPLK